MALPLAEDSFPLSRYKPLKELGSGSSGRVYLARDMMLNKLVAVKTLQQLTGEQLISFQEEAKATSLLNHKNIVKILDFGAIESGIPYMVLEYIPGLSLFKQLERHRGLPWQTTVDIFIEICRALSYAHKEGVMHRDVKPSNIIRVGGQHQVKITDFGIAHIENPDGMRLTMVGTIVGTPRFMSPEQARGEQNIDGRSDLFSVGVLLYYLLSGKHPFTGETVISLCNKILNVPPTPMAEVAPQVPAGLRRIVERLLNKDINKRFQSGKALAVALRGVRAEMDEDRQRSRENKLMPMRHRWAVLLTLMVALVTAGGSYWLHRTQVQTMTRMVEDFGASLVEFVAYQNGEWLLREQWPEVEVFVKTTSEGRELSHLRILDTDGIVRGSTDASEIGTTMTVGAAEDSAVMRGSIAVVEKVKAGQPVIEFHSPVQYVGRTVGSVSLGLSAKPVQNAALVTVFVMAGLSIVIVLIVLLGAYALSARLSRPLAALRDGISRLARGDFSRPVAIPQDGQFEDLIRDFNRMMESVEPKHSELDSHLDLTEVSGAGLKPSVVSRQDVNEEEDLECTLDTSSNTRLMPVAGGGKEPGV